MILVTAMKDEELHVLYSGLDKTAALKAYNTAAAKMKIYSGVYMHSKYSHRILNPSGPAPEKKAPRKAAKKKAK